MLINIINKKVSSIQYLLCKSIRYLMRCSEFSIQGDRRDYSDYKSIHVVNKLRKILRKLIKIRIESAFRRIEENRGFLAGRYIYT